MRMEEQIASGNNDQPTGDGESQRPSEPYLMVAAFCERVIRDAENQAHTLVNMFDRLGLNLSPSVPTPSPESPLGYQVTLFIGFRTLGKHVGVHRLEITLTGPQGQVVSVGGERIRFKEGQNGSNLTAKINMPVVGAGYYVFDIALDGRIVTRAPLEIVLQDEETEPDDVAPPVDRTSPPR